MKRWRVAKIGEIAAEIHVKFAIDRVAIAHRLGRLEIGETSVFIAVSAAHRAAAFDACRFAIDTLKRTVPIWKKEYFADGAVWADGELPPPPVESLGCWCGRYSYANCETCILISQCPPTSRRQRRVFALTVGLVCAVAAFGARGARSQDSSQPMPTPPTQQTDRPPWARKNKSGSKSSGADASKDAGSTGSSGSAKNTDGSTASTNPPPIVQPIPADDPPADSQQQRGRIKVNVQLVSVLASVLDEHNRPAIDIPREKFHVFEEDVEQKLEVFESETQQPLDLELMIDASLSAHKEILFEQEAAARFIRQVLRPGDRLAVYSVGEDVVQLAGFSDNVGTLESAVHQDADGFGHIAL